MTHMETCQSLESFIGEQLDLLKWTISKILNSYKTVKILKFQNTENF